MTSAVCSTCKHKEGNRCNKGQVFAPRTREECWDYFNKNETAFERVRVINSTVKPGYN